MKILLVDDEQKFAQMLAKRLALRGILADVCFSGEQALETVQQGHRFDVAILDVKMPGIGGIDLKRRLALLDGRMKYIFLTGHGSKMDYTTAAREAENYLPKPLQIDVLIETLNRLTEEPPGASERDG
ncbi:response regulator [Desulfosarcina alkanivorans]|uniref:Response regulator n=1 Tax=Desulfosarcina alkanivorans TaxID=571177 RepID=A0A5K7YU89_9BACT|nr:response regulator [Desulfosarcina alkanivorans]BBO71850.1 response regulator [Desulfosarcina alkanivorans]